ncbi:MAG TPA: hypothetical protein VHB21_24335, partial [Minicystis sp.]|nr:hypothetical protein [Minicystis sp.]
DHDDDLDDDAGEDAGEDEGEDELVPRVILARVADVAAFMPAGVAAKFGDRPIWFLLEEDAELVGLFDRIPEDPMSKGNVAAILGGLRAFAAAHADELQRVLGVTDAIGYGFHVDAPLARVRASFEDDGFDVAGAIEAGKVVEA